jgi:4-hydroxy-3-methylbut-2-enyl diphosphate reductase
MKIVFADHFGTCFGVRDAIAQAEALASQAPLTILGELVHNPLVRERLRAQGIREGSLDLPAAPSKRVMITAHGASDQKHAMWRNAGFEVVDGTCPLVRYAHQQLKRLVAAGCFPVVIGKAWHVEVRGLTEDFPEACVIELPTDIAKLPAKQRYGVVSQTTQPIPHVHAIIDAIRRRYPRSEVCFVDTVCKPTKDRQAALRALIAAAEVIVVVGGRDSNNTRQLVETCRSAGRRAIHVERAEEIDANAFEGVKIVGLTAGTSTMHETVAAVFRQLAKIGERLSETVL